jgi:putative transposase
MELGLIGAPQAFERRGETLGGVELHRLLNHLKRTPRYGWLYEVSKCAPQEALRDLDRAYQVFWQGRPAGGWDCPGGRSGAAAPTGSG